MPLGVTSHFWQSEFKCTSNKTPTTAISISAPNIWSSKNHPQFFATILFESLHQTHIKHSLNSNSHLQPLFTMVDLAIQCQMEPSIKNRKIAPQIFKLLSALVDGSKHDKKSPAIKATATRINDLHAKYRAKKPEAGQLVISKDKFSKYNTKVFLWEFWEVFFCISKQVPDGHPAEAILRAFLTRFEETTAPITSIENCILRKSSYA